jgi:anti-anti-sigma regulatory factor
MHEGRVLYAGHDQVHVLRYVGDVRHPLAASVGAFVDAQLDRLERGELVFDLTEAEAVDSTNLGEMARIADRLGARGGKRPTILSTRPDINQVLLSMAFDEMFDICTESTELPCGDPIPDMPASREETLKIILSAHRRLMQMSDGNRTQFTEVVALMERELGGATSESDVRL